MNRRSAVVRTLLMSSLIAAAGTGLHAAEGGGSHYLPGLAGDLGFALAPQPGLQVGNHVWFQTGELDAAVLAGEAAFGLEVETVLDIVVATYTTDATILGGTYTAGVVVPFGHSQVTGELATAGGGSFEDDGFGLGDIALVPIQLNWSRGNLHFELSQSIIAPTGTYDADDLVNIGRGYWSFDTVGAVTWLNPNWGTEVSLAWGLMHNAENTETEYHTGNESHVDWAVNQFLTEGFAVGLRGYRLNQLKGDSGEGAVLGPLEGFSQGYGAGFVWTPAAAGGQLAIAGKVMRDVEARDGRYESDHAQLSVAWTF